MARPRALCWPVLAAAVLLASCAIPEPIPYHSPVLDEGPADASAFSRDFPLPEVFSNGSDGLGVPGPDADQIEDGDGRAPDGGPADGTPPDGTRRDGGPGDDGKQRDGGPPDGKPRYPG